MILQRASTVICNTVAVCVAGQGGLRAEQPATSVLHDKAALIKQLTINDPERNPYLTLDEWLQEAPAPPRSLSKERRDAFSFIEPGRRCGSTRSPPKERGSSRSFRRFTDT